MKIKLNNRIGFTAVLFVLLVVFNSCVKDRNLKGTDFSQLQDHVLLVNGGIQNASAANVRFVTDTATLDIIANLASVNLPTAPVNVTIGIEAAQIGAYNSSKGTNFQPFPTDAYKLVTTALTIPSNQQTATTSLMVYKQKLDPSISYMLPISIKDASGKALSSNQNTIFFNVIGNVLAGSYTVTGTRYNYTGSIAWNNVLPVPAGYTATTNMANFSPRLALPDDAATVEIPFGNVGTGYNYIITYTPSTQTISIKYSFADVYSNFTTTVESFTPPAAGIKASFHIITHYNNALGGAGNDRIFDETFVQQ